MRLAVVSRLAFLPATILGWVFVVVILFIYAQLWRAVGRSNDVAGQTGFTIAQMIWYLAYTEAMETSRAPIVRLKVDEEVRTGDIAYRLARPLAYPLQHFGDQFGERILRFALYLLFGCGVALLVAGPTRLVPASVAMALLLTLLAFVADWILTFSISLCSFWVERTDGLHLFYTMFRRMMGGFVIPLTVYPEAVQRVLHYSPFPYLIYAPARIFARGSLEGSREALVGLLVLIGSGLVLLLTLYRLGSRRVSAQGG
jgi:ABC-2 type transport system permease protein